MHCTRRRVCTSSCTCHGAQQKSGRGSLSSHVVVPARGNSRQWILLRPLLKFKDKTCFKTSQSAKGISFNKRKIVCSCHMQFQSYILPTISNNTHLSYWRDRPNTRPLRIFDSIGLNLIVNETCTWTARKLHTEWLNVTAPPCPLPSDSDLFNASWQFYFSMISWLNGILYL